MDTIWCLSLLVVLSLHGAQGYPTGPPISSNSALCLSMMPAHGAAAQTVAAPYTIDLGGRTCYKSVDTIKVTLTPSDGTAFAGFLVEARMGAANSASYGEFTATDDGHQTQDCFSGSDNAISHSNGDRKDSAEFYWEPLSEDTVDITFTATIVRTQTVFWTGVTSAVLAYDPECSEISATIPNSRAESMKSPVLTIILVTAVMWLYKLL